MAVKLIAEPWDLEGGGEHYGCDGKTGGYDGKQCNIAIVSQQLLSLRHKQLASIPQPFSQNKSFCQTLIRGGLNSP